jgi:hypothetical protein
VQIFNVDISAALIDTFVTAYLPALAEKSGERLKHGGRKRGVMLFGSFRGPFLTCFYDMDNWFPSGPGRTESMAETQNDPLLPGYSFNAHLVAGLTPIEAEGYLDFYVDRPLGMKGYILRAREGVIKNHDQQFVCRPGDMLLFPPGRSTTMAVIRMPKSGITSGSTSVRAPTGRSGFWPPFLPRPVLSPG